MTTFGDKQRVVAIALKSGHRDFVMAAIQEMDTGAVRQPEGNPARMWVDTRLTLEAILAIRFVEDVVVSLCQTSTSGPEKKL
jgi:hypothetical protein